jgi:hypothetical protein
MMDWQIVVSFIAAIGAMGGALTGRFSKRDAKNASSS